MKWHRNGHRNGRPHSSERHQNRSPAAGNCIRMGSRWVSARAPELLSGFHGRPWRVPPPLCGIRIPSGNSPRSDGRPAAPARRREHPRGPWDASPRPESSLIPSPQRAPRWRAPGGAAPSTRKPAEFVVVPALPALPGGAGRAPRRVDPAKRRSAAVFRGFPGRAAAARKRVTGGACVLLQVFATLTRSYEREAAATRSYEFSSERKPAATRSYEPFI